MDPAIKEFFQQNEWAFEALMWSIVLTPILIGMAIFIWRSKRKKRRAEQRAKSMQRYALMHGYNYYPVVYNFFHYENEKDPLLKEEFKFELEIQHEVDDLDQLQLPHQDVMSFSYDLALFGIGLQYNCLARNVLEKNDRDVKILIFDYMYDMSGKYEQLYTQTVVRFHSEQRNWPVFGLRPEGLLDRIGAAFGDMDVDFDEYPEFSKQYAVLGDTEQEIREFLDPSKIKYFERLASQGLGLTVEGAGPDLLVFKHNTVIKTEELEPLLRQAREIFDFLS